MPFDVDELTDSGEHDLTEVFEDPENDATDNDRAERTSTGRSRLAPLSRGTRTAGDPDDEDPDTPVKGRVSTAKTQKSTTRKSGASARSSRAGRSGRPASSGRASKEKAGKKRGAVDLLVGLTNRWSNRTIGLALVMIVAGIAVALTLSAPLRNSMSDRSEFAQLSASNAELRKQIAYYEQKINEQNDPAYIEAQARERLHFVYPGEKSVVMMYPGDDARKAAERKAAEHANNPWYSNLWEAVATPPKK
ncbi:MAG: septum formation initiator family protein [Gordonia amarae]